MNDYKFGNFLCYLREKKGLTQQDIANELGVTAAAVSKWETGASKPRVEILFRLAQILDVKPEELMEGKYISEESLDSVAVKTINERYEYLRRTDSHETTSVKLKRVCAFLIDWNVCGIFPVLLSMLSSSFVMNGVLPSGIGILLTLVFMISFPVLFVLRDVIFGSKSLGKRILGLEILDKGSAKRATKGKRILRNVFFFVAQIDFVVLLVRGRTIGDEVAGTVVVNKADLEAETKASGAEKINSYKVPKKKIIALVSVILVAVILLALITVSIVFSALNSVKDTPEYEIALEYLMNTEDVKNAGIKAEDVSLNGYESATYSSGEHKKEYSFKIKGYYGSYSVILHYDSEADEWYVCPDCTHLK